MRARALLMTLTVLASVGIIAAPGAEAAKSPAMTACSGQWDTMKKDNKLPKDETWSQFWSQCSKDFAAKNPAAAYRQPPKARRPPRRRQGGSAAAEGAKKRPPLRDESDSPGSTGRSGLRRQVGPAQGPASGAHGWHDYFKFMAGCIKALTALSPNAPADWRREVQALSTVAGPSLGRDSRARG